MSRTIKKLILAGVLLITTVFLPRSGQAVTCCYTCSQTWDACLASCATSPNKTTCNAGCNSRYTTCQHGCPAPGCAV
jgi:hypothetical protein